MSSHKSKSHRHGGSGVDEDDVPIRRVVKVASKEADDHDSETEGHVDGGCSPVITFAKCLTHEQKSHLKQKMENELADLMGEKSTDGASRVVDDMFKEFLAEKMALIEAEKRKVGSGTRATNANHICVNCIFWISNCPLWRSKHIHTVLTFIFKRRPFHSKVWFCSLRLKLSQARVNGGIGM